MRQNILQSNFFPLLWPSAHLFFSFRKTSFFIYIIHHSAQRNQLFITPQFHRTRWNVTFFVQTPEMCSLRCSDNNQRLTSADPEPRCAACLVTAAAGRRDPLSGTQVCRGALLPLWSGTANTKGPSWSGLGACRGRALPSRTHPLRGLPIHTTRWWLDLSFNECYPSRPFRSCRTAVALSTSHCSLLPHTAGEQTSRRMHGI